MLKVDNNIIRLDDWEINGISGGKSYVLFKAIGNAKGVVTCGSRVSTQVKTTALVCEYLNIPCHIFMPRGVSEIKDIVTQHRGIIHEPKAGYNSVLNARARELAQELGYLYIPLGMLDDYFINIVKDIVLENKDIFLNIKRLVIPVGGGCFFIGLVKGLQEIGFKGDILGVMCGMDASANINSYLSIFDSLPFTLVKSPVKYESKIVNNLRLNENYEAKCLEFMNNDDVLISIAH